MNALQVAEGVVKAVSITRVAGMEMADMRVACEQIYPKQGGIELRSQVEYREWKETIYRAVTILCGASICFNGMKQK